MKEYYTVRLIFFNTKKAAKEFTDVVDGAMSVGSSQDFFEYNFGEITSKKTLVIGRFSNYEMRSYKRDFGIIRKCKRGRIYYIQEE